MLEKEKQIHIIKQNSFSKTLKSYIQIRANISFPHAMEFMELIPWDKYKINTIQLHPPLASQPLLPLEENGTRSERIQTTTMSDTHLAPTLAIHSQLGKKKPNNNKQTNKQKKPNNQKNKKATICINQFFIYSQSLLKTHQADAMGVYATMKSWKLFLKEPNGSTGPNTAKPLSMFFYPFWVSQERAQHKSRGISKK